MVMRRFTLRRFFDVSGVSGTGDIAAGVLFNDGKVVLRWQTETRSIEVWDSIAEMLKVHGHGGSTALIWIDQ